ncbi:nucleoside triphosphate pyrophosphohydrolase family protein [Pseudomonas gingeri]|uniref:nucleoside triphosphate pyrophosphohydrolase family protein n=1 Tax=Pseudomonas gingeri TaxID=117681 RepID=UPI0015A08579|nr:nucleoside triphosphate pyrophosphohydrolase family protein [Pseudomonas gingeri]NVZ62736.1 nucleoside triphosphate pyrophosphohydrolase family protein [Pseudomonas gingeri]NVZ77239.1 nucleoside triphosphate pyrophosphohydrolase family protein [Pseudomonas gingeri]
MDANTTSPLGNYHDPLQVPEQFVVLPPEVSNDWTMSISTYQKIAKTTDKLPDTGLELTILGLFGEVGSLLSALKKRQRDRAAFKRYNAIILEELGDVLWYFSNLASRAQLDLSTLSQRVFREIEDWDIVEPSEPNLVFGDMQSRVEKPVSEEDFSAQVLTLAGCVGDLLNDFKNDTFTRNRDKLSAHLVDIFRALVAAADSAGVDMDAAALGNLKKTFSRWPGEITYPPRIDAEMPKNERLPSHLEFFIAEENIGGKQYVIQKCNKIIIGDRLTDNKMERDDYRFHDVFHIAFAVHLGWSPVLRAFLHLKRKSVPDVDENQDGARAILIEEGVATFIFGRGLECDLFEDVDHIDYDLLKSIQEFVRGYEVERCALWQWEKAILEGFDIFRKLSSSRKGYITADFDNHTISFREGDDE